MKKRNYFIVFGNTPVTNNKTDLEYWKKNNPIKEVTSDFASNKQASQGSSNESNIPKNIGTALNIIL